MKIYLIQQENTSFYKIGITKKNSLIRLSELQIGNANKLIFITEFETKWDFKLETALHAFFRLKKVNSEWFELTEEDKHNFLHTCKKHEDMYDALKDNPFI